MPFCIVIYNSLGMSAFWEIHEKVVKISEICGVFLGRALGVDLGSIVNGFRDHFGSNSGLFRTILGSFWGPGGTPGTPFAPQGLPEWIFGPIWGAFWVPSGLLWGACWVPFRLPGAPRVTRKAEKASQNGRQGPERSKVRF